MNVSLQIEENRWNYSLVQSSPSVFLTADIDDNHHTVALTERQEPEVRPEIQDNVWEYSMESSGDIIETYEGPYTVIPTSEQQTLLTEKLRMAANVIIEPIPSNYGLITWNGSVLTVS